MNGFDLRLIFTMLLTLAQISFSSAGTLRITRVGRYLYDAHGNRFYIKGVAFQTTRTPDLASPEHRENDGLSGPAEFSDPLADPDACNQAIGNFRKSSINTIRVYFYDHKLDHTPCMNALEKAKVYVIADLAPPLIGSQSRAAPSWTVDLLTTYIKQIESLRKFPNLLAFNIGNDIVTRNNPLEAAPFIKAAARDVKAYLQSVNSAALVSYASSDGKKFPSDLARFLSCDTQDQSTGLDLFGINNYRWCGQSNFAAAYEELTLEFQGLNIAAFFSEFGCLTPGTPRGWTEVAAIFSTLMSDLWSGAIAYSYFPTPRGYGLVNGNDNKASEPNADFRNLVHQYRKAKPPNMPKLTSLAPPKKQCTSTNTNSFVIASALPPKPNAEACNCVNQAAFSCQVNKNTTSSEVWELLGHICKSVSDKNEGGPGDACDLISSQPRKGNYGILSSCSAVTRLNYALTQKFIKSGYDWKACSFGGKASVMVSIKKKKAEEVDQEARRCLEINPNKGMRQLDTAAYRESISGVRPQSRAKTSGTSSHLIKHYRHFPKGSREICGNYTRVLQKLPYSPYLHSIGKSLVQIGLRLWPLFFVLQIGL